mmetsp:Transcript_19350/g.57503  ORF Transcript_19350/g.57503 Transcript_19350/m.57503 type:complete len:233 (-) Transcript_19350:7-705(-)
MFDVPLRPLSATSTMVLSSTPQKSLMASPGVSGYDWQSTRILKPEDASTFVASPSKRFCWPLVRKLTPTSITFGLGAPGATFGRSSGLLTPSGRAFAGSGIVAAGARSAARYAASGRRSTAGGPREALGDAGRFNASTPRPSSTTSTAINAATRPRARCREILSIIVFDRLFVAYNCGFKLVVGRWIGCPALSASRLLAQSSRSPIRNATSYSALQKSFSGWCAPRPILTYD